MGNETQNKAKNTAIIILSSDQLKGKTTEELLAYIEAIVGDRSVVIADRDSLKEKLESLQSDFNELKLQNQVLEAFKEEATAELAELSQELSKAKVIADEFDPTIKHKGVEYKILGQKFTWKGKEHTIKSLQADKVLQAELIGAKVGFLIPKTDKPAEDTE